MIVSLVQENSVAAPFLLAFHGELTVVGKSADADSIRFIPDSPDALDELARADRKNVTKSDGSVRLRLVGIDTRETHCGCSARPLGDQARDRLLEHTRVDDVAVAAACGVSDAAPAKRRAVVLSKAFDPDGRPISYLLVDEDNLPPDNAWIAVDTDLLRRTVNAASLRCT